MRENKKLFYFAALLVMLVFLVFYVISPESKHMAITLGYIWFAISVVVPAMVYCYAQEWHYFKDLGGALFTICVAIPFRALDDGRVNPILPMGTHFLWHLLGGVAVFFLIRYVFRICDHERLSYKAQSLES